MIANIVQRIRDRPPIIVLEDEPDLRKILCFVIQRKYPEVLGAGTVKEIRPLLAKNPCLLFIDHNLPDGTGLDLVKDIREQNKEMILIMMTAQNSIELQKNAIKSGVNYFLSKPFGLEKIEELIDQYIPDCTS